MTRKLVVLLVAGLVFAPAASAKGPHVVLTSGNEPVEAGKAWVGTVELNEFPRQTHPWLFATRNHRRVTAELRPVPASMPGADGFKLRMVFPTDGRWKLTLLAEKRRFALPAIGVGSGELPQDYVAFPKGSAADRQGASGAWTETPGAEPEGRGTPLPPETVSVAEPEHENDGGLALWIPALGLALAGAGVWGVRSGIGRRD
jgi:hypothetical protein